MTRDEAIEFLELIQVKLIGDETSVYYDEMHEALDMAIGALNVEVVYLCDGKRCKECNSQDCSHTCDIHHAKNFRHIGINRWIEKED